jgi:hypothetical protein
MIYQSWFGEKVKTRFDLTKDIILPKSEGGQSEPEFANGCRHGSARKRQCFSETFCLVLRGQLKTKSPSWARSRR